MLLSIFRRLILLFIDLILVVISLFVAFELRFDGNIPSNYWPVFYSAVIPFSMISLVTFYIFNLYDSLWRYVSIDELIGIIFAATIGNTINFIINFIFNINVPRSIILSNLVLSIMLTGGFRFAYRIYRRFILKSKLDYSNVRRILVVGAGDAGSMLIKELMQNDQNNYRPVVIVDDASWKSNTRIHGIPVLLGVEKIPYYVSDYKIDEIIIAIPSLSLKRYQEIVKISKETKCSVKTLPGTQELLNGKVSINKLRNVEIEDLLGREEYKINLNEIQNIISNKRILVTGAGGSIGSEICRQILKFNPANLILFDIYENDVYSLQLEIKRNYPDIKCNVLIGSVRDIDRLHDIFSEFSPQIVFHAAAHKHVPLMEDSPFEAIKNNVFGTKNVVECSDLYKVEKFVLISTDKAVNPTNIMGASKRIAELIVQSMNLQSKTEFVAVRFGNVLGSNGSVIPLFKKQIALGGPVTVTHPDITRFFMTIPEASRLVLQACAIANGGEIFVLDMGNPVKIIDLAKQIIELSGFKPDIDIKIEFTGLRPGEKLYEELMLSEEGVTSSKHEGIFIANPIKIEYKKLKLQLENIKNSKSRSELYQQVENLVPTFKSPEGEPYE